MKRTLYEWKKASIEDNPLFFRALSQMYASVIIVDLESGDALVCCTPEKKQFIGESLPWDNVLGEYCDNYLTPGNKAHAQLAFSTASLRGLWEEKRPQRRMELCCDKQKLAQFQWIEISASALEQDSAQMIITVKDISETRLEQRVLDKFAYFQNCDYLILLDLDADRYFVFDVLEHDLPVPQKSTNEYTKEMLRYNSECVVKSEEERITQAMQIENIRSALADKDEVTLTCGAISKTGEYRRVKLQMISFDRSKNLVLLARTDITDIYLQEKKRNDQLMQALRAAQRDQLTGLYNQATTARIVSQLLDGFQGELAAVLFIDMDNFKMVNDTMGHLHGNEVLKAMGSFLLELSSEDCVVGRIGGDEFLLYLSNVQTVDEIRAVAQKICDMFQTMKEIAGDLPISCSVGVSLYPQDGINYSILVRKADQALYNSKRYGKNCYSFYSQELEKCAFQPAKTQIDFREYTADSRDCPR